MKKKPRSIWSNLYDGRKEHIEYPNISVFELLNDSAHMHMESISYNYYGTKRTYRQFLKQIDECARALINIGIKSKDVITLCLPNIPEAVVSFYAINKIGAISNLINPDLDSDILEELINNSKSRLIITTDLIMPKIDSIIDKLRVDKCIVTSVKESLPLNLHISYSMKTKKVISLKKYSYTISWSKFIKQGRKYKKEYNCHFSKDCVATIIYTKGRLSNPKGVVLSNLNINSYALASIEAIKNILEKDSLLCNIPIYSGMGMAFCLHTIQYIGGTTVLSLDDSSKKLKKSITKYRPNIVLGTPVLYEDFIKKYNMEDIDLSCIKCIISCDDYLPLSLKIDIDKFFSIHGSPNQVRDLYGMSECVSATAISPANYYREGTIGTPYSDTYYKIVKPSTFEEVKVGKEGEIIISGPTVMVGYLNDKEKTSNVLKRDNSGKTWLFTGDMGFIDQDGFIYFKDRID